MNNQERNKTSSISRRDILIGMRNVGVAAVVAPDALHALFLPQIEGPSLEQRFFTEMQALFPNIKSVEIIPPETDVDIHEFMQSFFFWLQRIKSMLDMVQEAKADPNMPDMYQNTVEVFVLDLNSPFIQTLTGSDPEGTVVQVRMGLDVFQPSSLAAELIHMFQKTYSISQGVSATNSEGASTAVHFKLMEEWLEHNRQAVAVGNPHEAKITPVINTLDGSQINNPTIDQFNDFLSWAIDIYREEIWDGSKAEYKKAYLDESTVGQSEQYHRRYTILQSRLSSDFNRQWYQNSIEQYSALFARNILEHNLSLQQIVVLCGLINNGVDHVTIDADQAVIDVYNDLKSKRFIVNSAEWEANKAEFLQKTVADLSLNVVFALKNENFSDGERLTLEAFQVISDVELDHTFFSPINEQDIPTAKLIFYITRDNGEKVWYEQELSVDSHSPGDENIFYAIQLPRSLWVRDGIKFWQESLEGKDMVVQVTQEQLLETPLGTTQFFEVKGVYDTAAVSETIAMPDETEMLTPVAAPVAVAKVEQVSSVAGINKKGYDQLVSALEKSKLNTTIIRS